MENEDRLLTILDMAKLLKISRSKAYSLIKNSTFPIIRIGKCIRISEKELKNWLHNTRSMI